MGTKLKTVSVRLEGRADAHVDKAAQLLRQSKGAFLARAGEEVAERVLLKWAVEQYTAGVASLSELAAQTHLPLEAIAQQVAEHRAEEVMKTYLASCRQLAQTLHMPKFYVAAKKAVRQATVKHEPT
jgi:uncharacterized protein (DUF1778 family)